MIFQEHPFLRALLLYLLFLPTCYSLHLDACLTTCISVSSGICLDVILAEQLSLTLERVAIAPFLPLPIHCILLYLSLIAFTTTLCFLLFFYCLFLVSSIEYS